VARDRSRALSRADVGQLLTREDIPIRERTLWRMLYEIGIPAEDPGKQRPGCRFEIPGNLPAPVS